MNVYFNDGNQNQSLPVEGIWFEEETGLIQLDFVRGEEDILNNQERRMRILDSNPFIEQNLYKVKSLITLPDGYVTMHMAADYFEVLYDTIKKCIQRNQEELLMNGLVILEGEPLREYKNSAILGEFMSPNNIKRKLILLNKRVLLNVAMLLRESLVARTIRYSLLEFSCSSEGTQAFLNEINNLKNQIANKDKQLLTERRTTQGCLKRMCETENENKYLKEKIAYYERLGYESNSENQERYINKLDYSKYMGTFPRNW